MRGSFLSTRSTHSQTIRLLNSEARSIQKGKPSAPSSDISESDTNLSDEKQLQGPNMEPDTEPALERTETEVLLDLKPGDGGQTDGRTGEPEMDR